MDYLKLSEPIFKDVKYYVSGQVNEKALELLDQGKATRMSYFTDYVTHVICGSNCDESDISDALDLYEIPALVEKWVFMCAHMKQLVNTKPFIYNVKKLLSDLVFTTSKVSRRDLSTLWAIISYYGGNLQLNLDKNTTHLLTTQLNSAKCVKASKITRISIVTPDWLIESVKSNKLCAPEVFHPRLIQEAAYTSNTRSITGFEPEDIPNYALTDSQSTQELLNNLKSRMPWNLPSTTMSTASSNVQQPPPPNVVAPSFAGQKSEIIFSPTTMNQSQNPVPKSIVHHTPSNVTTSSQEPFTPSVAASGPNFTRILEQLQQPRSIHTIANSKISFQQQQQVLLTQQQQQLQQQKGDEQLQLSNNDLLVRQQQQQQQKIIMRQQVSQPRLVLQQGQPQLLQNSQQRILIATQQQPQQILQLQQKQLMFNNHQQQQSNIQQSNTTQQQSKLPHFPNSQQNPNSQQQNVQQQQTLIMQQSPIAVASQPQQSKQGNLITQQHNLQIQQQQQHALQQQNLLSCPQPGNQQQTLLLGGQQQSNTLQQNLLSPQQQNNLHQQQNFASQQNNTLVQQQQQQGMTTMQQQQQIPQNVQILIQQQQQPVNQQQQILQQNLLNQQQQQQSILGQQQIFTSTKVIPQRSPQFLQQNQQLDSANNYIQQPQQQQQQQFAVSQYPPGQFVQKQQIVAGPQQQQQFLQQSPTQQQPQQIASVVSSTNPQQQHQVWQQHQIRQQQVGGPRLQWAGQQRQVIQLDAQTHQQLQNMAPEERAQFVKNLQKQRFLQQRQLIQLQQQRGGGSIVIRGPAGGPVPAQHVAWLQQQAKQQGIVLQQQKPMIQQQLQQQSALSPIQGHPQQQSLQQPLQQPLQQQPSQVPQQQQQQQPFEQLQRQRIQQLQAQREQAAQQKQLQPQQQLDSNAVQSQQTLVNAKTKTALANMLSIRLQSGGSQVGPSGGNEQMGGAEPSAAGQLRLMTAQHNAAVNGAGNSNRVQELLALQQQQQRRVGPQQQQPLQVSPAEIIRPQVLSPSPNAVTAQGHIQEKVQNSPRSVLPIQHRPGTFYGHNPNLKLPPDLFLLGCIFIVVEIEGLLDDFSPKWRKVIEKFGGEIEKQYCSRITHVLCKTQRHGVVMQALREYKRCVTHYWLFDVLERRQVLPPWIALHLPTMYLDKNPGSKHLIAYSGFRKLDILRVTSMIDAIGAQKTNYLSKHNTLLIVSKVDTPKSIAARKYNIPIVNVQWLTEIMLGHSMALNQLEHVKYQQFSTPPNFSFDPVLVPTLMQPWKMPINISQESYERVKRSSPLASGESKVKKPKLDDSSFKDEIKIKEENKENNLDMMSDMSVTHRIMFSGFIKGEEPKQLVIELGGSTTTNPLDATHLVVEKLRRTYKLLHCVALGTKIVGDLWLRDSRAANHFLEEQAYLPDCKEMNKTYNCDFALTLNLSKRNRLFEGKTFFITPSVFPSKKQLTELVLACGGKTERVRRSLAQIESTNQASPYSYVILTVLDDIHLVGDVLKAKHKNVCNTELVLNAITKQNFDVEPYLVC